MDANQFVAKLKANNVPEDIHDLANVLDGYKEILDRLPPKNRAAFSLNVLCTFCRNLDKAPKWRAKIDCEQLLILSIACVRETRIMERADRVKTLACIYHIHRYIVNQNAPLPPQLVLKLSFMPFELDAKNLLNEYSKTYWNIFVDRLTFIEKLDKRSAITPIIKLLPKITEDILKIIEIYDTIQFCSTLIVFLVKKLHFLYNYHAKELNEVYKQIYVGLSRKDTKIMKNLSDEQIMEMYVKFYECLHVVAENSSKINFSDCPLDTIVRTFIPIVGHRPDLFHCLQTFFSNAFCCLLTTNCHAEYSETVLKGLTSSLDMTEKLGYKRAMIATYPYIKQFLGLYIEYNVSQSNNRLWVDNFNTQMQEYCLKLLHSLMGRLEHCNQLQKCENCCSKTGLHDALRISFLVKHFITIPISEKMSLTEQIPILQCLIENQYGILNKLKNIGCINYEKYFRKVQTDIHNTAIALNKAQYFEFSIKLFNIYLNYEMNQSTPELDLKNITRALYNKSICELDAKLYESALVDAFLSLVYSNSASEKYMSLVIDIKAKELKTKSDDDDEASQVETLQKLSVIDACAVALEKKLYEGIASYLSGLELSKLLKHEFAMYCKLWPSIAPISGVWDSILALHKGAYYAKQSCDELRTLYEVIVETPSFVRNISNDFKPVIKELLQLNLDPLPDSVVVRASLLFLDAEIELATASLEYGWRTEDSSTVPEEYVATQSAIQAVRMLAELMPEIDTVRDIDMLRHSLRICGVFVAQLLHLSRDVEGLQLALCCCRAAERADDDVTYIRNAGIVIYHASPSDCAKALLARAASKCAGLADDRQTMETVIIFMCDAAIYYNRCGDVGNAARLVQTAQAKILEAYDKQPDVNLDIAVGRLLEAQHDICKDSGPSLLTAVYGIQRHYLTIATTGSKWYARRLNSLTIRYHTGRASLSVARAARRLRLWRRARGLAAAATQGAAPLRARLYAEITDAYNFQDAQIKINLLKNFMELQLSDITQHNFTTGSKTRPPMFMKHEVEVMLDMVFDKSQSPFIRDYTSVRSFTRPAFLVHDKSCDCYACSVPFCTVLAAQISALEASTYYRAKEINISRNYFNGILKMFPFIERRLKSCGEKFKGFSDFIVNSAMNTYWESYWYVKIDILIEMAFFELNNKDYDVADEHIVEIHEIMQELKCDDYLNNEVINLMVCSARARETVKKPIEVCLQQFEDLELSPLEFTEPPKTPVSKHITMKPVIKMVARDEEVPKKRKVIKLNLGEGSSDVEEFKTAKKLEFKIPIPVTSKHDLELATPSHQAKPTPLILVTQPSVDTPQTQNKTAFFTPKGTPEQFFTPMTSVKTYKKKTLQQNIVKNLKEEFSTPNSTSKKLSENNSPTKIVPSTLEVLKKSRGKKKEPANAALKRATSPGKLCKAPKELPKPRRLRKPVDFNLNDNDKR